MIFLACIIYADDQALLAPLRSVMQGLIDICVAYGKRHCLTFNLKKTKCIVFSKLRKKVQPIPLKLDGMDIKYVHEWKYLGATISMNTASSKVAPSLLFKSREEVRKFY